MRPKLLALVIIPFLSACSEKPPASENPPTGKEATIQFRRGDSLGGGGNLPTGPTVNSTNGAAVSLSGKIIKIEGDWVVVEVGQEEIWIPKSSILLIQYAKQ
jgi:hypothetical protein